MPMNNRLLRPRQSGDRDALRYIAAVESADQQSLEPAVRKAINAFIVGCKADGIWSAIKASCILAGARTLAGALVPLVGAAPTNVNFVSGDYNRKTGLVGNGTSKYLDSNRNNNADPQNSYHQAVYATTVQSGSLAYIGAGAASAGTSQINTSGMDVTYRSRQSTGFSGTNHHVAGFIGHQRSDSVALAGRGNGSEQTSTLASETPHNGNVLVFARNSGSNVVGLFSDGRLAFYSIGQSLSLALLDSRVSTLITAIGAAIP